MARPRTAKTEITDHADKQKTKFKGRNEPNVDETLGDAPHWIKDTDTNKAWEAWETLRMEIPWLNSSHRILVATASNILGRMIAGEDCGVQAMNLLRQCLGRMGATPADASKAERNRMAERRIRQTSSSSSVELPAHFNPAYPLLPDGRR